MFLWVSKKLWSMGLFCESIDAEKIAKHLQQLYGTETTPEWHKHVNKLNNMINATDSIHMKLQLLLMVLREPKFHPGCNMDCNSCKYGQRYGFCNEKGSEFNEFMEQLVETMHRI